MARAIKLINAPVGLFDIDGVLVLKTEYSTQHEDGAITPDCYIVDSGEYFWGGVDSVEERNNLMVTPIDMPTLTPPNEAPPCYQPDGDGCAYQCYDGDDEPIDKCKECPLCYSDKQRHHTPPNEPLTLEQLREMDGEPVWVKCLKPSQYTDPPERWRILEKSITGHFGVWNGDCALIERNYGTDWLAYRRPPEGAGWLKFMVAVMIL